MQNLTLANCSDQDTDSPPRFRAAMYLRRVRLCHGFSPSGHRDGSIRLRKQNLYMHEHSDTIYIVVYIGVVQVIANNLHMTCLAEVNNFCMACEKEPPEGMKSEKHTCQGGQPHLQGGQPHLHEPKTVQH